jgi:hypothetical protein
MLLYYTCIRHGHFVTSQTPLTHCLTCSALLVPAAYSTIADLRELSSKASTLSPQACCDKCGHKYIIPGASHCVRCLNQLK